MQPLQGERGNTLPLHRLRGVYEGCVGLYVIGCFCVCGFLYFCVDFSMFVWVFIGVAFILSCLGVGVLLVFVGFLIVFMCVLFVFACIFVCLFFDFSCVFVYL